MENNAVLRGFQTLIYHTDDPVKSSTSWTGDRKGINVVQRPHQYQLFSQTIFFEDAA